MTMEEGAGAEFSSTHRHGRTWSGPLVFRDHPGL